MQADRMDLTKAVIDTATYMNCIPLLMATARFKLPKGFYAEVMDRTGITDRNEISLGIKTAKVNLKNMSIHSNPICVHDITPPVDLLRRCKGNGCERGRFSPYETAICKVIRRKLHQMPPGGHGIYTGTPTAMCVAPDNSTLNNKIVMDNLGVGFALCDTTNSLDIVIGDAVDPHKAQSKINDWASIAEFANASIWRQPISGPTFYDLINRSCNSRPGVTCKVVLLTSGTWESSWKSVNKYGFDVDFRTPSRRLTKTYPLLHILAMAQGDPSLPHGFVLKYLHNGQEETFSPGGDLCT